MNGFDAYVSLLEAAGYDTEEIYDNLEEQAFLEEAFEQGIIDEAGYYGSTKIDYEKIADNPLASNQLRAYATKRINQAQTHKNEYFAHQNRVGYYMDHTRNKYPHSPKEAALRDIAINTGYDRAKSRDDLVYKIHAAYKDAQKAQRAKEGAIRANRARNMQIQQRLANAKLKGLDQTRHST